MFQEPITVLIVDDEIPIREQMRTYPWESWGAVLIGEAEDGEDALQFCRDYRPDLVITDITMPVLDGMELLRALNRDYPQTKAMLLTCHSDFHFAKEGIQLGATDYLVKVSFTEAELEQSIRRAREHIRRHKIYAYGSEEQQKWELAGQLNKLLQQQDRDDEQLLALLAAGYAEGSQHPGYGAGVPLLPGRFCCVHLDAKPAEKPFADREIQRLLAEYALMHPGMRFLAVQTGEYALHFVVEKAAESADPYAEQYVRSMESLLDYLRKSLEQKAPYLCGQVRLSAWISPVCEAPKVYVAALEMLCGGLKPSFYWQHSLWNGALWPLKPLGQAEEQQLDEWLAGGEKIGTQAFLQGEFMEALSKWHYEPTELKLHLAGAVSRWLRRARITPPRGLTESLLQAPTLQEWIETVAGAAASGTVKPPAAQRAEVLRTRKMVEEKLSEAITLQSIAKEVGLTPHYLGKLFRDEVGEPFQEYVTRLRIEKSIELLRTTNDKIYEVASRVGITSYRYFSLMFRQYTGQTPTEFKRG